MINENKFRINLNCWFQRVKNIDDEQKEKTLADIDLLICVPLILFIQIFSVLYIKVSNG